MNKKEWSFNIFISNKWLYTFLLSFTFLSLALMAVAYESGLSPQIMGHSAEEIEVEVQGIITTLQGAIDNDLIGRTFGNIVTVTEIETSSGQWTRAVANCPTGYKVISCSTGWSDNYFSNYPNLNSAACVTEGSQYVSGDVIAVAICMDRIRDQDYMLVANNTPFSGTGVYGTDSTCPEGFKRIGCGFRTAYVTEGPSAKKVTFFSRKNII